MVVCEPVFNLVVLLSRDHETEVERRVGRERDRAIVKFTAALFSECLDRLWRKDLPSMPAA